MSTLAEKLQGAYAKCEAQDRKVAEKMVENICMRMGDEKSELHKLLMHYAGIGATSQFNLPVKDPRLGCAELYKSLRRHVLFEKALAEQTHHPGVSIQYDDKRIFFNWSELTPQ